MKVGQCRLYYKHTVKCIVALHVSACSTFGFSATEWRVYHASKLPLRIAWCDSNIIFPSWCVYLSCEEGT